MSSKTLNLSPASISDFRKLAEKRLPRPFFDYIDGAAYQEVTAAANISAFDKVQLRQRILRDISTIDTGSSLLEQQLDFPLILGPIGLAGVFSKRGEVQAVKAANKAQLPFCLSTVSICSIDEVAKAASAPFWFQLYVIRNRDYSIKLLKEAQQAGCQTLILTVDLPLVGERYRDVRNGLTGDPGILGSLRKALEIVSHPSWVWDVAIKGKPLVFGNLVEAVPDANGLEDFKAWVDEQFDPSMTWEDLSWIREYWDGDIIIKGIMDVDDAKQAVAFGANAIVVSNHGGRQLDGVPATLEVLPEIVLAVNNQSKIILDGGIRSGLDIFKALALGADACLIGRAWAYALAAGGEPAITQMLGILKNELRVAMGLTGCTKIADINKQVLRSFSGEK